jgi:hypothetical protein
VHNSSTIKAARGDQDEFVPSFHHPSSSIVHHLPGV